MKVTTKKEFLAGVAARWDRQYRLPAAAPTARPNRFLEEQERISTALHALPPDASEADVAVIVGNSSWTKLRCDECWEEVDAVVSVGAEPEIDSATARVCLKCAEKAVAALRGAS